MAYRSNYFEDYEDEEDDYSDYSDDYDYYDEFLDRAEKFEKTELSKTIKGKGTNKPYQQSDDRIKRINEKSKKGSVFLKLNFIFQI